ncbi:MAG: type I-C CRISPR-associated protein Cas8c/Csd1 [Blautia sp.]|nr:type I-C CRISPR-associated protein Cas8c/Csd1 [Blautia sp.]MCM1201095.1 type I-C CRISPR-associated protein Cas8c/Csd1 [Bacteroides fragilis]
MAWLKTLAETYDVYSGLAGEKKNDQAVLLPISHSTFNAQIEVTIDAEGNFQNARKLDKGEDVVTIIPVTEDSAARSSGIAPHPLCDKLCYIAGDYSRYTGEGKEDYFRAYMKQLCEWAQSDETHPMVRAIYKYLERETLIQDLVENKVLELDENDRLTDKVKLQGLGQTGANVRFTVNESFGTPQVWKNQELYKKYRAFYRKKTGEERLCYASGRVQACSDKHPSKIRNSGDKAKLISGNDESGFTYRGRFTSKDEAVSVGYDTSQKAHNALRWLIQKQGYTRDGSAMVCWMVNRQQELYDVMQDSVNACLSIGDRELDFYNIDEYEDFAEEKHDTGKYFADKFNRAFNGYAEKIKADDKVAVIALDAATTGRLSVVYYDEMGGRQYIDAIRSWQQHCSWRRSIKIIGKEEGKRRITCESSPSPREIALAAFGIQRSEWLEADDRDGKLIRNTVKRLLPCITRKGIRIPEDIIRAAVRRASMPQTMSDFIWYNDVLCVVCAMLRYKYEKEEMTMEDFLEKNCNDPNILFGRLLAVFDYMEQRAMFERDENGKVKERRTTNAKRYWNAYCRRPAGTAATIKQNLVAYEKKLSDFERMKFEEWTGEIMMHFSQDGYSNSALSELYLPGYYQQMEKMKNELQKKNNKGEVSDEQIYEQN